jgi:hypothetical protein
MIRLPISAAAMFTEGEKMAIATVIPKPPRIPQATNKTGKMAESQKGTPFTLFRTNPV